MRNKFSITIASAPYPSIGITDHQEHAGLNVTNIAPNNAYKRFPFVTNILNSNVAKNISNNFPYQQNANAFEIGKIRYAILNILLSNEMLKQGSDGYIVTNELWPIKTLLVAEKWLLTCEKIIGVDTKYSSPLINLGIPKINPPSLILWLGWIILFHTDIDEPWKQKIVTVIKNINPNRYLLL